MYHFWSLFVNYNLVCDDVRLCTDTICINAFVCSPNKSHSAHSQLSGRKLVSAYLKPLSARLLLLHAVLSQKCWAHGSSGASNAGAARVTVNAEGLLRSLRAADLIR